jgi:hypothetical protein
MREEDQLKRPEMEHIPDSRLHGMERRADERREQRIERPLAAEDTENELRDEAAIGRIDEADATELLVDEFRGEAGASLRAGEDIGRSLSGSRHDSTSGPNRIPSTMG